MRHATRRCLAPVLLVTLVLSLPGCGTVFGGTRQNVRVDSSPDGASVRVGPDGRVRTTPTTLELERKGNYVLTFSKDGYQDATLEIDRRIRGVVLAFDILAGLVGVIVDAATGGWYKLEPREATVTLSPATSSAGAPISVAFRQDDGRVSLESTEPVQVRVERR